ncbi:MAG: SRPBCC domain-containing protein [Bacteroidetes bacterium]|nr:SRPBCC domain-containing protein [Bacteroidota bacterium]
MLQCLIEKFGRLKFSSAYLHYGISTSDDWHAPKAENDLQVGKKSTIPMAAKDGSFSFDLIGEYINIKENEYIEYNLEDGRNVQITFEVADHKVFVT